jgi:hypothetical protein
MNDMARQKEEKDDLETYTQIAESRGTGSGDPTADDLATMDVTKQVKGGPSGEDRSDWDEPGVDTGGGMDLDSNTPSGGSWGDTTGLSSSAGGPGAGDWVDGNSGTNRGGKG